MFADDYQPPGIARAVSFFQANLDWSLEEASAAEDGHRWAVLRTRTEPDTRPFGYLAEF